MQMSLNPGALRGRVGRWAMSQRARRQKCARRGCLSPGSTDVLGYRAGSMRHVRHYARRLAREIVEGHEPTPSELLPIAVLSEERVCELFEGIGLLRESLAPKGVHLCSILNVKSGRCTEDCGFCSQSRVSTANVEVYGLLDAARLTRFLLDGSQAPLSRRSLVAAGRRASPAEVTRVAQSLASVPNHTGGFCASLGLLGFEDLRQLRQAGLTRYHCNLETARSHFPTVCSSHSYDEKLATLAEARRAGLSLCAGGVFGMGETDEQVLELALDLRRIHPDAVPLNFLVPIPGTSLAASSAASEGRLSPLRCLKIIALFRFVLPRQDLLICAGRVQNLGENQDLLFAAGASGLMTGNYLTTSGLSPAEDLRLIGALGLSPRDPAPD